jgi:uncharacterized damage-inducible protein DinB
MSDHLARLLKHARWADDRMLDGLATIDAVPDRVLREAGHVLGAEETWLSRLERRSPRVPVWPALTLDEIRALLPSVHDGLLARLESLDSDALDRPVHYANSAGQTFETPARDILLQVALHGQYHRGKINVLLRDAGLEPVPVDYIFYVRGVPAATTPPG